MINPTITFLPNFAQVDSWLSALQTDCKLGGSDATTAPNGACEM